MEHLQFDFSQILSTTMILFAIIDILGSIPIIIELRKKAGHIESEKAAIVATFLMIVFLFAGKTLLNVIGVDVASFAIAGSFVIFAIAMEMVLGLTIFKDDADSSAATSIVPLAFPLIAGAGTMTTLISLKSQFEEENIIVSIFINLVFIYIVLRSSVWIEKKLGNAGTQILRKIFGVILIAIAIKIFKSRLM